MIMRRLDYIYMMHLSYKKICIMHMCVVFRHMYMILYYEITNCELKLKYCIKFLVIYY